jgi:hypothetical protein
VASSVEPRLNAFDRARRLEDAGRPAEADAVLNGALQEAIAAEGP